MDNYSKVLTFFMENGITLTQEQIEALQEEFLDEATIVKEIPLNKDWTVLSKNAEDKELLKKNLGPISNSIIKYIKDYYSADYMKENIDPADFKKYINTSFIGNNFMVKEVYKRHYFKDSPNAKVDFFIDIFADWSTDFMKNGFNKLHDDHILSVGIFFDKNSKWVHNDMMFDG